MKVWVGGAVVIAAAAADGEEDGGWLVNVVLMAKVCETSRKVPRSPFVVVEGRLRRRGPAISLLARRVIPLDVG
ncbi:MAG: hypothetical protein SXV54_22890 [Chloroflexota bacterium]|nr:hypothetical protein [Chloroflexota bacterium]